MSSILDVEFLDMEGNVQTLRKIGNSDTINWLVVNVASACGMTRHYSGLQELSTTIGMTVVGFPCNQFGGQEPGSHEEICDFTSTKYGVDFPLMAKIDVKGDNQAELFRHLSSVPGVDGHTGPIRWNFEKFLINLDGIVTRYAPQTKPRDIF